MSTPGSHAHSRFAGLSLDDGVARVVVLAANAANAATAADAATDDGGGRARDVASGELVVIDAAEAELPAGVVADGRVRDNAALGRRLGQLWRELSLGGVPTYLGLQPADSWVQVLELACWPDAGIPAEVARSVEAMRSRYREDPVWSVAAVDTVAADPNGEPVVRVVGCRREDLSAAAWAARRSGIWVAGIKLTVAGLVCVLERPRTGGLVWIDRTGDGPTTLAVLGGDTAPGLRAVGRFGNGLPLGSFPVAVAMVDAAGLRAWTAALDPGLAADEAAAAVAGLLVHVRFEPLPKAGASAVLAADSPRPVDECAAALGLAVVAAGVGPRTDDLQRSLLHGGVGTIQGRQTAFRATRPHATDAPSNGRGDGRTQGGDGGDGGLHGNASGGEHRTGKGTVSKPNAHPGSLVSSLLPPPRAQPGVVRSVGLLHGGSLERSRGGVRDGAQPPQVSAVSAGAAAPLVGPLPFLASIVPNRPTPAWVHRAGLFRGQPHVAVLDGDHLELRGAVRQAIVAQQIRRSAVRLFGADAISGELCIHPDADPDAPDGVRWDRRLSFGPGATELLVEHDDILDDLLDLLEDYPWVSVVIEGHSDVEGDLGDNLRLSKTRADAVAGVLVAEGCDAARIAVRGRGPFVPLADGDTPVIRALHRRVEVTFLGLLA